MSGFIGRSKWALIAAIALVAGFATLFLFSVFLPSYREFAVRSPPQQIGSRYPEVVFKSTAAQGLRTFNSLSELRSFVAKVKERERFIRYLLLTYPVEATTASHLPRLAHAELEVTSTASEYSKTNIQVEGIEEPDIVKTNGRTIAVVSSSRIYLVNASRKQVESIIKLPLTPRVIYLEGDTLIAVCASPEYRVLPVAESSYTGRVVSALLIYDVSDLAKPRLAHETSVTGWFIASRMSKGSVYLVASHSIEEVEIPEVDGRVVDPRNVIALGERANTYVNVLALDPLTGRRGVISILTELGGRGWVYMRDERLYVGYSLEALMVEDIYEQFLRGTSGLIPQELYDRIIANLAERNLTAALNAFLEYISDLPFEEVQKLVEQAASRAEVVESRTSFHVFCVNSTAISYLGSFSIPGVVMDQFSMEEREGYFVVAATRTSYVIRGIPTKVRIASLAPQPREIRIVECGEQGCIERVVKLREIRPDSRLPKLMVIVWREIRETDNGLYVVRLEDLKIVGNLTGLAPGERVYSSRLIGDTFYLVTFRNIDPLYAIDVSAPGLPKVLGYVKAPGFSEYLHPLPYGLLLGIGWDPESNSLKISLFNVSDPRAMSEISCVKLIGATSPALQDHHAVQVWLNRSLILIPASAQDYIGGIAALRIKGESISLEAFLEHPEALRSLYIGSEIYTISPSSIRIFNADSLNQVAEVHLEG